MHACRHAPDMSDNASLAANESAAKDGKTKVTTNDAALKLAHNRLSVLQLPETMGNVSQACRRGGLQRTSFYEFRRRFREQGLEGLKGQRSTGRTDRRRCPRQTLTQTVAMRAEQVPVTLP